MSKIIYVNDENTKGPWLGHSWKNAYNKLQDALAVAQRGSQIWVAKGTYKPTEGDDRYASFFMKEDVELYGGFDGTEKELSQRDWKKNETILSGNIGDPNNSKVNSFHIVVGVDNAAIDGFTITEGNALDDVPGAPWSQAGPPPGPPQGGPPQGPPPGDDEDGPHIHLTPDMVVGNIPAATGAGMVIHQCAPEVRNCVFKDNVAGKGGGLYVMVATHDENGDIIEDNDAPLIINCDFINNFALKRGGGVSNDMMTHPTYVNCKFIRNRCAEKGGGMYNDFECSPTLISCLFAENSAVMAAGNGNDGNSNPLFVNCTVTRNEAEEVGAGIYQGTGPSNNPVIINSIVWGNICDNDEANIANWHQCGPEVSFSCIEGGYAGLGNIDQDPRFVDPENLDFRLDSMSPCIDAGDGEVAPETDIEGNPRYKDKKVPTGLMAQKVITGQFGKGEPVIIPPADMGAYERQEDSVVEPMDVIYVRSDVDSNGEGSSWDSTYKNLQQAMDHAFSAGADVWVKSGTYKPTETLNRETSFILREGVKVYGGFKGDETSLDRRDYKNNETILTGDLGGSNSYHVLIGANDAVLDGFTITGGCADGPLYNKKGGGMINYAPGKDTDPFQPPIGYSPKVTNCIFKDNFAMDGAAVYSFDRGKAEFTNCIFENNKAGSSGGAVMDNVGAFSTFDTCTFKGNTCQFKGGAIFLDYGSRATIKTCKFEDNKAGVNGGAIYTISRASQLENTRVTFDDCEFSRNTTGKRGGAVYNFDASFITFTKCAFTENKAGLGGGAIATDFDAVSTIKDCSFNANSSEQGENDIDKDDRGIVKQ